MAKKFRKIASIKDTEGGNFGNYKEGRGGGTPVGQPWKGRNGRIGWEEREKSGEVGGSDHREDQPRDKFGHFTYNSVNGKETKYDGRGKTVNPLLTGGDGTIKIDDYVDKHGNAQEGIKTQFKNKSGSLYDQYKGSFFQSKSMKASKEGKKYTIKLSQSDIWDIAKYSFDVSTGEFGGHTNKRHPEQSVARESANWVTKKGAPGKAGAEAKKFAKKTGQEQYVLDENGAIKQMGEGPAPADKSAKILKKMSGEQLAHGKAMLDQYRAQLIKAGHDMSNITDEQLDQILTKKGL